MKIGVFGDSFADKNCDKIWWKYLESIHRHEVKSFGERGSSLSFSMEMMDNYAKEFEKLIWCFTSVNRISFWYKDKIYHNTGTHRYDPTGDPILDQKRAIIHDYISLAFDWSLQERLGKALAHFVLSKFDNLILIPCFATPVYFMEQHQFNLYKLCQLEAEVLFPGKDPDKIVNSHVDRRQGHITDTNQKRLAELINNDLTKGIFCTDYNNFLFDKTTLESEFSNTNDGIHQ